MSNIVKVALEKPLTFIVMAILIAVLGALAAFRMPVDIFPAIRIPVIAVAWQYTGLAPEDMANRIVTPYERALTTTVSDIEHIESQSLTGVGIIKIFFQPGVDVTAATAQITAISQTLLRQFPPGTTPPFIISYSASTVPILQLGLSGEGLTEQQLYDFGLNQIRPQLVTIPGLAMPAPSGGKQRQVQLDINPVAMQARGLSAQDISAAMAAQNQINPAGFVKIGPSQYNVRLNNSPDTLEGINNIPVKVVNGATIYIRDVANVRDGNSPQQNIVHVEGGRSVLLTILKNGGASTLAIVQGVKDVLPRISAGLPDSLKVLVIGDQSIFVKAAVTSVLHEGAIAATLTSLMILVFLGSWRSTVIIAISIPLAVLAAVAALSVFGQTLNVMTLGGLALAIGILVDDATVTIENINWHLEKGKGVRQAILDGAAQIVTPAFVSLLCICIVFVPMFLLPGVSGFLFVPMALSVVFAMVASFVLSRTLVPTMAMYLLKPHQHHDEPRQPRNFALAFLINLQNAFERAFERLRSAYVAALGNILTVRKTFAAIFACIVVLSFALIPFLGSNFFPDVDSGRIAMHVRVPPGLKVEESAARFEMITRAIRQIIPSDELDSVTDNIGVPFSVINTVYNNSGTIGPQDGDITISLKKGHAPTREHVDTLRSRLPGMFPGSTFSFLPADITSQILNFGAPSPIDIQIIGRNAKESSEYARLLLRDIRTIAGLADARIQQSDRAPQISVAVDRSRMGQYGLTARDVTASLSTVLAGSSQSAPVFFVNPENGVSYPVVTQTPEYWMSSMENLRNVPVSGAGSTPPQTLGALATMNRSNTQQVISHYNIQPIINIFAATQNRDLGAVARDIEAAIARLAPNQPKGVTVTLRGQNETMNTAFLGLGFGLLGAVALIYFLIVVNFQSWIDPIVIISALPAALAGIVWMLFVTMTTVSVPALTGAIMCMGVATANAILVVSFARERFAETGDALQAALEAGQVRFRPVLMTALAMIIGMLPMALAFGEGAEQNAPLGIAVIGGLIAATFATLFLVPTLFSLAHSNVTHSESSEFVLAPT